MNKLTKNKRWPTLANLCWTGFDKVMVYASKEYPTNSRNESLDILMNTYIGDWEELIKKISK